MGSRCGFIFVMLMLVGLMGCESDAGRIRAINEAAASGTPISAEIQAVEIEEGDCINSTLPEDVTIESVVIVPCTGAWQYRALGSFEVPSADQYPGEGYFERQAYERCDKRFTFFLFPLDESWGLGDREVTCLQDSFGLSTSDRAKLDRLISIEGLDAGACFNEAPETGGLLVESVDCSEAWESRLLNSFDVEASERYPGEGFFDRPAYETCDRRFTTTSPPSVDTWAMGDREVICLQESFGLSATDPAKLDRLASIEGLSAGVCFNEASETGGLLVELVDCSEAWEFRILNSFGVEADGRYPDDSFFNQIAYQTCDKRFTTTAPPSVDTWALGDREVICLQESFGLSATDPAKLDRLIGLEGLDAGACFNEAPETGGLLVERVDCSGAWESRVEHRFSVSLDTEYPAEFYFQNLATRDCGANWDYYYAPNQESWSLGDRFMICVTER